MHRLILLSVLVLSSIAIGAQSRPQDARAKEIFKQLIEINTTDTPAGSVTKAAEAVAARLKAAGFPAADVTVAGPDPRKFNLVARYRGTGTRKPLLLLAHLDVVEAKREDWSFDPFVFLERDGFFYGRGTSDDKSMAATLTANLIRLKEDGFKPDRDLIMALTADEEGGNFNGVQWLLKNKRDLIDAEIAINEGGSGQMKKGKYQINQVQAAEKVYQDFHLESRNPGGHSSRPVRDNAIYHLSDALGRLAKFEFPANLGEITRTYFERMIVPFDKLEDILAIYDEGFRQRGLDAAVWGHISDGNLHPNVIPTSYRDVEAGKDAIRAFGRDVIRLGGSPLAEHGVGRHPVKQELLEALYGPEGIAQMRAVKRTLDPDFKLSPGVIFSP